MKSISGLVQSQPVIILASILVFGVRMMVPPQFFRIEVQDQYAAHPHSDRGQGNAGYAAFPADFIQTVGHSAVVGEKYGNIGTQTAGRREAVEQNLVAHCIFGSLLVGLPDFIMNDFRCGNGNFAAAAFGLPLLDIGSRLGHGLLRFPPLLCFTADVRAAETEMVGGEHCGCTGGCNNNDFSGIGGHIGLMGNGWFQYRIWSRMAKMICGAIWRLSLLLGCGLAFG